MNKLIEIAAKYFGTTVQDLQAEIDSEDADSLISNRFASYKTTVDKSATGRFSKQLRNLLKAEGIETEDGAELKDMVSALKGHYESSKSDNAVELTEAQVKSSSFYKTLENSITTREAKLKGEYDAKLGELNKQLAISKNKDIVMKALDEAGVELPKNQKAKDLLVNTFLEEFMDAEQINGDWYVKGKRIEDEITNEPRDITYLAKKKATEYFELKQQDDRNPPPAPRQNADPTPSPKTAKYTPKTQEELNSIAEDPSIDIKDKNAAIDYFYQLK